MLFLLQNIKSMSHSLISEDNPQVVAQDATVEEIDIDHVAINLPVNHDKMENVLKSFTGNTVELAQRRDETGIVRPGIS